MRRSLTIAAALTITALATPAAAAPVTLTLDPGSGTAARGGHRGEIELQSYSFGPMPATRVNKVDGFTVKQQAVRDSSHKPQGSNQMALDDTPGAEKSGQATGKRQHMPIRTRSAYDQGGAAPIGDPYVLTGVSHAARLTVQGDLPGCRVGQRFASAALQDGARTHRLRDLTVSACAGQTVTFTYTVSNPSP